MSAVSLAIQESGAAEKIARALVDTVGGAGPHLLLVGLFLLTAVLGQLIRNTATALIVVPIAISAANLMVMGPGGYRFGDYWKLGLCVMALFMAAATLLVPVVWSF